MLFLPMEEAVREFLELDEIYFAQRSGIEYERVRKEKEIETRYNAAYTDAAFEHWTRVNEANLCWLEMVDDDRLR